MSPETGAYAGNQRAAMNLFSHGLRDRVAVPDAGGDGGRLWTRVLGRHDGGLRMAEGKVEVDTDSTLLQIGGDVLRTRLGSAGAASRPDGRLRRCPHALGRHAAPA